jgi:hypothetical protein
MPTGVPRLTLALVTLCAAASAPARTPADAACSARHAGPPPRVVELYTSEGCSSCPPADRWLSGLRGRGDVLALAFHVSYWDRLGWKDRFAAPAHNERQAQLAQRAGARQVYTPQVVVDGVDWRGWPQLPGSRAAAAPAPALSLERRGERVFATVTAPAGAVPRLAGYWAVLEDRHTSRVTAGENAGEALRHDHVVRLYEPVAPWLAAAGGVASLAVSRGVAEHPRRVAFVVTDAATGRPLQALALDC